MITLTYYILLSASNAIYISCSSVHRILYNKSSLVIISNRKIEALKSLSQDSICLLAYNRKCACNLKFTGHAKVIFIFYSKTMNIRYRLKIFKTCMSILTHNPRLRCVMFIVYVIYIYHQTIYKLRFV